MENYNLDTLAEILAQIVHFARDDYQQGVMPDESAWNAAYIAACFTAQHTLGGEEGVDTEHAYKALQVTEDVPYAARVGLAKAFILLYDGEKP